LTVRGLQLVERCFSCGVLFVGETGSYVTVIIIIMLILAR